MRILLDTNAYSAMVQGHEKVCALVRMSERVLLSTVVEGELLAPSARIEPGALPRGRLRLGHGSGRDAGSGE